MDFVLGIIIGLLIGILTFTILAYFRAAIEQRVKVFEKQVGNMGPKAKGEIYLPEDEEDMTRREHVEKNRRAGKDTPISELQ